MSNGILLLAALLASGAAFAQTPPNNSNDPLKEICTGFLAQSGAGVSGDQAKLCTCLVGETQKQLTRQEMEIYNKATSSGAQPPAAIMQKVMGIATLCLTQR
jgi:hypothetical protein